MNVNYEYYRIFYYVAKYKNITQAAKALQSNQPNISRAIRLLESETGCRLLIRSNRGISLTPEGKRLYGHVKVAVERLLLAEDEIAEAISMQNGCVTIGASETALRMLLLPVLGTFKKNYPGIRIRILNHLTVQAIESVKNGEADFAVVTTLSDVEKPLVSYPIIRFRDALIGGPAYGALCKKKLTMKELMAYPVICLGEDTVTYQFYENFYHSHGLLFKPELQAATTDQILPMVRHDLGIGYMPEVFAKDAIEKGEVYRLSQAEELPSRQICFVENERYPLSIAAKELKSLLMQCTME
ncbi:MAG: LysR family transcriptional regulator [Lachnospiraceae bacterium]|nr:LysR family transcriptional regulator [Lachnospiraceae bacterium]